MAKLDYELLGSATLAAGTEGTAQDTGLVWPDRDSIDPNDIFVIDFVGRRTFVISASEVLRINTSTGTAATDAPAVDDDVDAAGYNRRDEFIHYQWIRVADQLALHEHYIGFSRDADGKVLLVRDGHATHTAYTGTIKLGRLS